MLTTGGAAKLLSVHINTMRRWSNQGITKSYRLGKRGDRRFLKKDVTFIYCYCHFLLINKAIKRTQLMFLN